MATGGGGHARLFLLHGSGPYVTSEPSGQQYGRKAGCRGSEDSLEPIRTNSPALFSHHAILGDTESCRRDLGPLSPLPARAQDSEELMGLQATGLVLPGPRGRRARDPISLHHCGGC